MTERHGTEAGLRHNLQVWEHGDHVAAYAGAELSRPEAAVLRRHRDGLAGRVLEIGMGAGRLTGHLIALAARVDAIDISERMVRASQQAHPAGHFLRTDARDLSAYAAGSFDAVVAPNNVLGALDHAGRLRALAEAHRVLVPGGLLVLSAHNRAFVPRVPRPWTLRSRRPRTVVGYVVKMAPRLRNHARLRRLERAEPEYALVNDEAHDFLLLHYYVDPAEQRRQLVAAGFVPVEALGHDGRLLAGDDRAPDDPYLHYVARRDEAAGAS